MTNFIFTTVNDYFKQNTAVDLFLDSLVQCYKNPEKIFQRITNTNNIIFVSIDSSTNSIKGYLFYQSEEFIELNIANTLMKCFYNGYALINETYRKTGALHEILKYSTEYLKKENLSQPLLFYAITSNPFALRGYYSTFDTIRPPLSGEISEEDIIVADNLKRKLFIVIENNSHPFIIKTGLPQRYTDAIRKTFIKSSLHEVGFLNSLSVNESMGDRFLFYWIV